MPVPVQSDASLGRDGPVRFVTFNRKTRKTVLNLIRTGESPGPVLLGFVRGGAPASGRRR
jgi:hypothetical protein